jgi:phosphoserine phosphatase
LSKYLPAQLEELGKYYSIDRLPNIIYKEALDRIEMHKKNNHRVIILTASSAIWLSEWCKQNNLELIGTKYEVFANQYTGKILGGNCYGRQKLLIVKEIISKNKGLPTYGYGDSKADKLFLGVLEYSYFKPFRS